MSKITAIIQARLNSTRLPGKVLMDIEGKPMLQRVIERVKESTLVGCVIVAIPHNDSDKLTPLIIKCESRSFLGSENDVLDRFYRTVTNQSKPGHTIPDQSNPLQPNPNQIIIRVTSDCPLIDPQVIDKTVRYFIDNHNLDYLYNRPPYPDGLDTEVFTFETLERVWREAEDLYDREHVTLYIQKHPELFRIGHLEYEEDLSHYKWSVDTAKDLEFVRYVYRELGEKFYLGDILKLLRSKR